MRRTGAAATALATLGFTLVMPAVAQETTEAEPAHPAHVHSGTCAELGSVVAPLQNVTFPASESAGPAASPGSAASPAASPAPEALGPSDPFGPRGAQVSVTRLDLSIREMLRNEHAINVHLSDEAIDQYIACGDISGPRGRNMIVPLQEQNGSGYQGVAFLHADGDQTLVLVSLFGAAGTGISEPGASPVASPALPSPASIASPAASPSPVS